MDAISAAASVASIVQVVYQALKAINWLQDFCEEYATDHKSELLNDLATIAATLTSVKSLCEQVQQSDVLPRSDFRTHALSILIEDCAKELESWLQIAKRLKSKRESRPTNLWKTTRFAWNTFVNAASRSSRAKLYERLQWYQQNIETSLAVFGRKFDLSNTARLRQVEEVTEAIHEKICDEAVNVISRLDSLSASSSSLLASSRSTDERLKDVKTDTSALTAEIRNIKEMLLEVLSSASSRSNAQSDRKSTNDTNRMSGEQPHREDIARREVALSEAGVRWNEPKEDYQPPTVHDSEDGDAEPEFETLIRATSTLVDALHKLYHPVLAEYISTTNAVKVWETYLASLKIPSAFTLTQRETQGLKHTSVRAETKLEQAKAQLGRLRRLCRREALTNNLAAIDRELGIDAHTAQGWEETVGASTSKKLLPLEALTLSGAPEDSKREASTRLSEWMLGHALASKSLLNLYHSVYDNIVPRNQDHGDMMAEDLEDWKRQMLKFWFLDSSEVVTSGEADSVIAPTDESDATVTQAEDEVDTPSKTPDNLGGTTATQLFMLRCIHSHFPPKLDLKIAEDDNPELEPSAAAPLSTVYAARDAVKAYEAEPSSGLASVMWTSDSLPEPDLENDLTRLRPSYSAYDLCWSGSNWTVGLIFHKWHYRESRKAFRIRSETTRFKENAVMKHQ